MTIKIVRGCCTLAMRRWVLAAIGISFFVLSANARCVTGPGVRKKRSLDFRLARC
jgi:hypothetical protein